MDMRHLTHCRCTSAVSVTIDQLFFMAFPSANIQWLTFYIVKVALGLGVELGC